MTAAILDCRRRRGVLLCVLNSALCFTSSSEVPSFGLGNSAAVATATTMVKVAEFGVVIRFCGELGCPTHHCIICRFVSLGHSCASWRRSRPVAERSLRSFGKPAIGKSNVNGGRAAGASARSVAREARAAPRRVGADAEGGRRA